MALHGIFNDLMDDLVLAMSSREFIALRGFTTRIAMEVLESLQQDTWFAVPDAIQADPLAVAVHIAVLPRRGSEVLIAQDGRLLHPVPITAEIFPGGPQLVALRQVAERLATAVMGAPTRAEIAGFVHDPVRLPHTFVLVYQCLLPADAPAPSGAWMTTSAARGVVTELVDRLALEGLP